jgi:hypothetical protein
MLGISKLARVHAASWQTPGRRSAAVAGAQQTAPAKETRRDSWIEVEQGRPPCSIFHVSSFPVENSSGRQQ